MKSYKVYFVEKSKLANLMQFVAKQSARVIAVKPKRGGFVVSLAIQE